VCVFCAVIDISITADVEVKEIDWETPQAFWHKGVLAQMRHHTAPKTRVRAPVSTQKLGQARCPRSDIKGGGGRVLL
jgi:hypothetical protein